MIPVGTDRLVVPTRRLSTVGSRAFPVTHTTVTKTSCGIRGDEVRLV